MPVALSPVVRLHPHDNIVVAAEPVSEGAPIETTGVTAARMIPIGHKIAVSAIFAGQPVKKFGQVIGLATKDIAPGDWVHSHNLAQGEFSRDPAPCSEIPPPPQPITGRTFLGYERPEGKAGTRNYIALISSVNCSATVSKYIARHFTPEVLNDFPQVDGVVAFTHTGGCGMQFAGQRHEMLNRVLGGIAKHPNIGGYLLIGLGCEQGTIGHLVSGQQLHQINGIPAITGDGPTVLVMQDAGGTRKTVQAGIEAVMKMLPLVNNVRRQPIPASEIILGTECGGSDGNSGVTANPAVGVAADLLVACGGTSILAETPEIFGAEHLLTRRAKTPKVAQKLLDRISWWQDHVRVYGVELDNNPSVGNKAGGLTTIAEKSLGAVAKAGSTALVEVYQYAEQVTAKGLVVMDTPGFDPPSVTGMVAGGANMVLFTTGRGSCFGCKPTPSIKIATNTPMYQHMEEDMDINAGTILSGTSVQEVGQQIFEEILAVASGKQTKSELLGYGDDEFVPWFIGPTL